MISETYVWTMCLRPLVFFLNTVVEMPVRTSLTSIKGIFCSLMGRSHLQRRVYEFFSFLAW